MSSIQDPFHGLATELHMTASIGGTIDASTKVAEVSDIGTLENTANIIEFNNYGYDFKRKLVGQKDAGSLTIALSWVPGDTTHQAIKSAYDAGSSATFAVRWVSQSENATAEFKGFIASFSIDQPSEDVVSASVEIAIDGGITFDMNTQ